MIFVNRKRMLPIQFKPLAPLHVLASSSSPLFTSRASTETPPHTENTEAGTRPAKSIGERDEPVFTT